MPTDPEASCQRCGRLTLAFADEPQILMRGWFATPAKLPTEHEKADLEATSCVQARREAPPSCHLF